MRDPIFTGQFAAAARVLGLYSPLLGAPQPDFPPNASIVGSTFYDRAEAGADAGSEALERFLAAGPPPAVFTLGSAAVLQGETFYRESLAAARRLGLRAVLLVGPEGLGWIPPAPDVLALPYAPHGRLFPRCRVIVHHGGMGTTAQALRAARPQLVVPFYADQPDNAARLVRLGVARTIPSRRYSTARAAAALAALVGDADYTAQAAEAARQVAGEDGAAAAARAVVEVLEASTVEAA
jgi:UDP:flavonoid glycosyltransferase YjiC (YdhE family)